MKKAIFAILGLTALAVLLGQAQGARFFTADLTQAESLEQSKANEPIEGATPLKNDLNEKNERAKKVEEVADEYRVFLDDRRRGVIDEIVRQAEASGVNVGTALRIAFCESAFDGMAKSRSSTAKGVYQFTDRTWQHIGATKTQFNVEYNIAQFMRWYPTHPEWWECR